MTQPTIRSVTQNDLLEKCVNYCIQYGFSDLSLRTLASSAGTSHRMLIYHFGNREKLLQAILENFRYRQLVSFADDLSKIRSAVDLKEFEKIIPKIWHRLMSDELRSYMIAFYEFYVQCLRTRTQPDSAKFFKAAVDDWLEPITAALYRMGVPPKKSLGIARLIVSSIRGLILDGLAAPDQRPIEQTFDILVESMHEVLVKNVCKNSKC
jgi:AcrR family transcriptional regulator